MKILFIADIVGGPGRKVVRELLPGIKERNDIDFCIVNGENAAGGFGLTEEITDELFSQGIDVITSGNHIWDRKEIASYLQSEPRLLRPVNYPAENPGRGSGVYQAGNGVQVGVINLQGRVFMKEIDCPFHTVIPVIHKLKEQTNLILVDFHGEATAEKVAMGWYLDGQVAALIGTHTHVQTADERVLPGGTGYISDAGMCGGTDGVIGIKKELAIRRFITQTPNRFQPEDKNLVMMGVILTVDPQSCRTEKIERFQIPRSQAENNG
ncbi:MAG: TIGR00282 family metallophosphoesterase [Candidatus Glassbacteria bacterium]|nr:TIGR00282 family metallophosphoesterase [Candidatus Glassbacteria bacterium]